MSLFALPCSVSEIVSALYCCRLACMASLSSLSHESLGFRTAGVTSLAFRSFLLPLPDRGIGFSRSSMMTK